MWMSEDTLFVGGVIGLLLIVRTVPANQIAMWNVYCCMGCWDLHGPPGRLHLIIHFFVFRHVLDCPMSETSKMIWSYPEGTHGAGIIGYGFFIFILFHSLLGRDLSDDSSVPRFRFCVSWCFASKHGQLVLMERPFSRRISVELV